MVTYVPVGHTVGLVNTSIGTGGIVTTRNNSTFITALNPKEFYYLYVEVLAVIANSDQVAAGKCINFMHIYTMCSIGQPQKLFRELV